MRLRFLLVALVPMLIVGLVSYFNARSELLNNAKLALISIASSKSELLDAHFDDLQSILRIQSSSSANKQLIHDLVESNALIKGDNSQAFVKSMHWEIIVEDRQADLRSLCKEEGMQDVLFINSDGLVLYSNLNSSTLGTNLYTNKDHSSTKLAQACREAYITRQSCFADFEWCESTQSVSGYLVTSIDLEEKPGPVMLAIQISTDRMDEILAASYSDGNLTESYLIGADLLMRSNLPNRKSPSALTVSVESEQSSKWKTHKHPTDKPEALEQTTSAYVDYKGEDVIGLHRDMELLNVNMALIVEIPQAAALQSATHLGWIVAVLLVITGFLALLVVSSVSKTMSRPLCDLVVQVRSIADGNLGERIGVQKDDEIGEMARAVNHMTTTLAVAMSELKTAKQNAEAANKSKSDFLTNMSHEIRTPMTAILGFTELVLESTDFENACRENTDALNTIKRNGEYLLGIMNDILDLSAIEDGRMQINRSACDICMLVDDLIRTIKIRAEAKNLELSVELRGALPETIQTDPIRLRQILNNLLANAIKYTEIGKVSLICELVEIDGRHAMQFDVQDTGIGMKDQQIKRLFIPFSQADNSLTRKYGGTGLGLAISRRFAALLGGNVSLVDSKIGEGSRFRVLVDPGSLEHVTLLEGACSARPPVAQARIAAENAKTPLEGMRILFVEDGPDNQRLISHLLRKSGAEVCLEENGKLGVEAALAAIRENKAFDVILMDMQMPVMDGYTATSLLRGHGLTLPIIALTAHAMGGEREKCLAAGCNDFGAKPIGRKKLVDLILKWSLQQTA